MKINIIPIAATVLWALVKTASYMVWEIKHKNYLGGSAVGVLMGITVFFSLKYFLMYMT